VIKVQAIVTHVATNRKFECALTEVTLEEMIAMVDEIKDSIADLTYLDVGGTILPGDFIRNHCVIEILKL